MFVQVSLCKLTNLRKLFLNSNQIDFSGIPAGIGKLHSLEVFSASNNNLETIPEGVCRSVQLKLIWAWCRLWFDKYYQVCLLNISLRLTICRIFLLIIIKIFTINSLIMPFLCFFVVLLGIMFLMILDVANWRSWFWTVID